MSSGNPDVVKMIFENEAALSQQMWNSSSYLSQSLDALPPLVTMGNKKSRQKLQHAMTKTSFTRLRR